MVYIALILISVVFVREYMQYKKSHAVSSRVKLLYSLIIKRVK